MSKNNVSEIQIENDTYIIKYYPDCTVDHGLVSIKPYCSNLSNFRGFLGFSSRQALKISTNVKLKYFLQLIKQMALRSRRKHNRLVSLYQIKLKLQFSISIQAFWIKD